jgi:electron transport protein HydN
MGSITLPVTPQLYVTVMETASMPVQCKHCENSPCLAVCKQKAISRVNGQVIVDKKVCIGCKDCLLACPFGAISLLPFSADGKEVRLPSGEGRVAASKCDLCYQDKEGPACVRACPNEALRLTDVNAERKEKNIAAAEALAVIGAGSPERRTLA